MALHRSPRSGASYSLKVLMRKPASWASDEHLRREVNWLSGHVPLTNDSLSPSSPAGEGGDPGTAPGKGESISLPLSFELHAMGFHTFCTFHPGHAPLQAAWPPLRPGGGGGGDASTSGGGGLGGLRICGWLEPGRSGQGASRRSMQQQESIADSQQLPSAAAAGIGIGAAAQQKQTARRKLDSGQQQQDTAGDLGQPVGQELQEAQGQEPVSASTPPPTFMVVSPFYGLPARDFATLLLYHMNYHEQLQVERWVCVGLAAVRRIALAAVGVGGCERWCTRAAAWVSAQQVTALLPFQL